ncbi:hypothetical protein [Paracoccus litorisediminis]|uniref:Uncharacterized protein n=1 Tax=Paracoccus litorisediminis TaxID=2006130 RepID=A0A844HRM8_9RHOB|nr:hypothetical protein [Paracoccus litorisediminis]MTH61084.1 hypothetical protein [Paracoccus litorisediminis]
MRPESIFCISVAATVCVIALCITAFNVTKDPKHRALGSCINDRMESTGRIDCARAIYGTEGVVQ